MINLKIIVGSTRPNRFSEKAAAWITPLAKAMPEMNVEVLDLRDYPMPHLDYPASPSTITDGNYPDDVARKFALKLKEADAFIIVTPEYNRGTSGVLKNALDHAYYEWNQKAVAFVAYGTVGGARATEQLRLSSIELQMAPIRQAVHIFAPWTLLDEKGELKAGALDAYKPAADGMLAQLMWWAKALQAARMQK